MRDFQSELLAYLAITDILELLDVFAIRLEQDTENFIPASSDL